ncbi:unnamed protein product [Ixodes persulcatus]
MVQELKMALAKRGREDVNCMVARFLFKQHTTIHVATGKTPAWMLFGRELPSALERLKTFSPGTPESTATFTNPRKLNAGQAVWVKTFPDGKKWIPGVIERKLGHRSWMIRVEQGSIRRHTNHIRPRRVASHNQPPQTAVAPGWDIKSRDDLPPRPATTIRDNSATAIPEESVPVVPPTEHDTSGTRRSSRDRRPPQRYGHDV